MGTFANSEDPDEMTKKRIMHLMFFPEHDRKKVEVI